MDDLSCQDVNFAGPATTGATPKWNLEASMLQAIQQLLGCPDLDGLACKLADRLELFIALPGPSAKALDMNRLGWPT